MPKKGTRKARKPVGDPNDPENRPESSEETPGVDTSKAQAGTAEDAASPPDDGAGESAPDQGGDEDYIGENPKEKKKRVLTDLPGGKRAAKERFEELTEGEEVVTDPDTGVKRGKKSNIRLRETSDGKWRIDIPASRNKKHETIHFNDRED